MYIGSRRNALRGASTTAVLIIGPVFFLVADDGLGARSGGRRGISRVSPDLFTQRQ